MTRLFALVLALFTSAAFAETRTLFSKDGSKATVLMLAVSTNPDAVAFNQMLALPVQDESGKLTKKSQFKDDDGVDSLDVACAFSKIVAATGSCFVVFHKARGVMMDPGTQQIQYEVMGAEAQRLAKFFTIPVMGGIVFQSSDNHFLIAADVKDGAVQALRLSYK